MNSNLLQYILNPDISPIYLGCKLKHKPKSIFDSGFVKGNLVWKTENESLLKDDFGNNIYVSTSSLRLAYPEIERFKKTEGYCVMNLTLKYGEINSEDCLVFRGEKEYNNFIKINKYMTDETEDTKWKNVLIFKDGSIISINVSY